MIGKNLVHMIGEKIVHELASVFAAEDEDSQVLMPQSFCKA